MHQQQSLEYIKQKLVELKGEINKFTIIANTTIAPFSANDIIVRQKISKSECSSCDI